MSSLLNYLYFESHLRGKSMTWEIDWAFGAPTLVGITVMHVSALVLVTYSLIVPERASWLPDLEAELFAFPGSRHDDQCDSISQALQDKNLAASSWPVGEQWDPILASARIPPRRLI